MSRIKIACETYTWQMPGESYKGKLDHIMGVTKKAGFAGIEPDTSFFGDLVDPIKMKDTLQKHQLELVALCHVEDWRNARETEEEKQRAQQWIGFMAHFPDTIYLLVQMPGEDRNNLTERQQNLLSCVNSVAERAADKGIVCSYHQNSPPGSIYRTEDDYKILLNGLNNKFIGYTPDVFFNSIAGRIIDASPGLEGHQNFYFMLAGFSVVGLIATVGLVYAKNKSPKLS